MLRVRGCVSMPRERVGEGGLASLLVVWLCAAGGAHWLAATYSCFFFQPSPSAGAGAHQPLTTLCPPSPCLPPAPYSPFQSLGWGRGGVGFREQLGLTHTETQRGMWWTTWTSRGVGSNNRKTTPATTSTTPSAPPTGPRYRGNNTGGSGRRKALTRRSAQGTNG